MLFFYKPFIKVWNYRFFNLNQGGIIFIRLVPDMVEHLSHYNKKLYFKIVCCITHYLFAFVVCLCVDLPSFCFLPGSTESWGERLLCLVFDWWADRKGSWVIPELNRGAVAMVTCYPVIPAFWQFRLFTFSFVWYYFTTRKLLQNKNNIFELSLNTF